jgi:hypothetical protein
MQEHIRQMLFILSVVAALPLAVIYIGLNTAPNPNGPNLPVWLLHCLFWTLLTPIILYVEWNLEEARRLLAPRLSRLWQRFVESESVAPNAS